jgi:hypothetical protein
MLWLFSVFGALGFHRFYLGKKGTGFLWLITGGLFGIGSLYDVVTLPQQVREANIKAGVRAAIERGDAMPYGQPPARAENPEKTVLRVAKKNGGFVTPGEVALEGELSLDQARKLLEKLAATGSAEMRVRSSGVVVYFFPEFARSAAGDNDFAV